MTELNGARILEDIEKNYQFYFFLFSTFVIFMGAIRLFGKRSWHDWEKLRRK
jgi:hypothetical protein